MDVFALASDREAFGLGLVEAMFMSLPVIAVGVGGPLNIVEEGKTGFLVAPHAPSELASAIETLHREPSLRVGLGKAGFIRARNLFSADRYVADVEKLYLEILK